MINYNCYQVNLPSSLPPIPSLLPFFLQACQCQPPLEEGDQVLFVNGMATETATHMEVECMTCIIFISHIFTLLGYNGHQIFT